MAQRVRTPAAALQQHFQHNIAVVVGINRYENVRPLHTAEPDARYLAALLEDEAGRRDPLDRYKVIPAYNEDATCAKLTALLKTTLPDEVRRAGAATRVIFYFAGHGDAGYTDNTIKGYLFPQDARPREQEESERRLLSMDDVQKWLVELDCQHVLIILDCCSAGAMPKTPATRSALLPPPLYWETLQRYVSGKTRQAITSAAHNQQASDIPPDYSVGERDTDEGADHSPFALALFEALAADPLHDGRDLRGAGRDGVVTATELYLNISDSLYRRLGDSQTPGLWTLNQGHEAGDYIFLLPGAQVQLEPAPDLTGPEHDPWPRSGNYDLAQALIAASREAAIRELNRRVEAKPLVAVTGRSGSGKTSLVLGMLLPRLREGVAAGSGQGRKTWQVLPPLRLETQAPVQALIDHLGQALGQEPGRSDGDATNWLSGLATNWAAEHPRQRLLLAVDCAEALFQAATAEEQARLWALLEGAAKPNVLHIILTVPGDRWETPAQADDQSSQALLPSADRYAVDAINPFNRDGLRQVIDQPAAAKMIFLESEQLIGRMLDAVEGQPAALPLLTETLHRMYMRHATGIKSGRTDPRDRTLTRAYYEAEGGVEGVIADLAQGVYDQWPDEDHRRSMQHVLMRLVKVEAGQYVGGRARQADFAFPDGQAARRASDIIAALAACGLVAQGADAAGEPYVELGHSGLITAWPQMQKWLVEQGAEWALQRDLTARVEEWQRASLFLLPLRRNLQRERAARIEEWRPRKPKTLLWRDDPRLPQVEATLWPAAGSESGLWGRLRWEWRVLFPPKNKAPDATAWVNRGELEFVRASVSERSGFRQKLLGAVAAFVIAVVALSGLAWWQRGVAALAARQAQSNELAAQSRLAFSESALSTGLLLASESYRLSRSAPPFYAPQAQQALFDDLNETGGRPQALAGKAVFQTAVSHDGNWLATGSTDNHVRLWSVAELWANPYAQPREIGSHGKDHPVITVAFSPDSAWLATGSTDGVVGLWPIANQESSTQGKGVQISLPTTDGHLSVPRSVMFSPKGQWLVVVGTDGNTWFYERQSLLRDPTPQPRFRLNATEWPINTEARPPVAFDPDERHLAAASMNNAIWLWDFDNLLLNPSSAPLTATLSSGGYPISIMFSPDGNWFAATSSYAIAYLWRIENVAQPTPDAPIARIHPLVAERQSQGTAFSPDGRWFAVRNANSVSLWDLASLPQTITTVGILKSLVPTMNPTGTDPVEAFAEQTPTRSFTVPGITSVEFSSDERSVLAGDSRGRLQLWDFQAVERGDLRPRADLLAHEKEVAGIFAVPGNDIVITQSNDGDIRLWKTSNPQAEAGIVSRDIGAAAFDLAISPDGRWVATGGIDGQVRLWDASQLREDPLAEPTIVGEHSGGRMVMSVAFSPDGVWLASGGADGAFGLWPTDPSVPRRQATDALIPLPTTEGRMLIARNITFSPQGRWLAVSDSDGNILLYNFAELTQNTRPQPFIVDHARWRINPEAQPPISFSPDEQRLAAASLDNAAWIWSIDDLVTRSTVAVPITVPFGALVSAVSFSSDGNWFAIGSSNAIRLWKPQALIKNPNTRAFAEITPEADSFVELAFSSDNQLLVATNQNRTLLWYVEALRAHAHARPIALRGITASHDYLAVAPKGEWLATLASMQNEGHLALWTVAPDLRVKQACAIAGRNLTAKEWQFYFPATAPGKICDQWPAPTSTSTQLDHAEESR